MIASELRSVTLPARRVSGGHRPRTHDPGSQTPATGSPGRVHPSSNCWSSSASSGCCSRSTATAVFGVRRNEQNKFSAATLTKLDTRIQDQGEQDPGSGGRTTGRRTDPRHRATRQCWVRAGFPPDVAKAGIAVRPPCGKQFPMTFAEAKTTYTICGWQYKPAAGVRQTCRSAVPGNYEESAACFYAAVAADGLDGLTFQQGERDDQRAVVSGVSWNGFSTPHRVRAAGVRRRTRTS